MIKNLSEGKCEACRIDAPLLSESEIEELLPNISSWSIIDDEGVKRLMCSFAFIDYEQSVEFTNKIAQLAEEEDHHPEIILEWGKVCLLYTSDAADE